MTKKKITFLKLTDMSAPPRTVLSLSVMISRSVGGLSGSLEFFWREHFLEKRIQPEEDNVLNPEGQF